MRKRRDTITPVIPAMPQAGAMLSVTEAARMLGVSERSVRRRVAAGELPAMRIPGPQGSEVRIDRAAVAAYRLLQEPGRKEPDRIPSPPLIDLPVPAAPLGPAAEPAEPASPPGAAGVIAGFRARLASAQRTVRPLLASGLTVEDELERALDDNVFLRSSLDRALNRVLDDNAFLRARLVAAVDATQELSGLLSQTEGESPVFPETEFSLRSERPAQRRRRWFRLP